MFELCRAEWIKIVGHRRAFTYLLGIFPLGATLVFFFASLTARQPSFRDTVETSFSDWADLMIQAWTIPSHPLGRILLMGITAFAFAGEYQWGTWKNITPGRWRATLILVKFAVLSALILATFTVTSLIMALGGTTVSKLAGVPVGPALDFEQVGLLVPDYLLAAATAFLAFLVTAIFAVFVAIYSRSILSGSLAGVLLIFSESLLIVGPRWLSGVFEMPGLLHLPRAVPMYNIANISSWIKTGEASRMLDSGFLGAGLAAPSDGAFFSVAVVAGWVLLGVTGTILLFERQDITT